MVVITMLFTLFLKIAYVWGLLYILTFTPREAVLGERQSVWQRTAKNNEPLAQALGLVCNGSPNLGGTPSQDRGGGVVLAQHMPPSPAPIPPSTSRITATVLTHSPAPVQSSTPSIRADATLDSLTVEIHTSEATATDLESLARPEGIMPAFAAESLGPEVVGQRTVAMVQLTGNMQHSRWMISHMQRLFP